MVAVQVRLETEGFTYHKWGGVQRCKAGDWLVDNNGNVYTVDRETFESTYEEVSPGVFEKTGFVWAVRAITDGEVKTKEGVTPYRAGDYILSNDPEGKDRYATDADTFEALYEEVEGG